MTTFKDKHVLITGGASGLGFLMGKQVLQHQAKKLIIWDIDSKKLDIAADKLHKFENKVLFYKIDVSKPNQIYHAAQKVLNKISHLDILINNAGIVTGKPFYKQTKEKIDQTISINLLGAMHTTRAFLPQMVEQKNGHIVNIASAAGLMPNPKMSVYAGSKWGLIGWSESLRVELDKQNSGIHVTTIEPSYINTGMFDGITPPLLTPLLDAHDISKRIIRAVEKNKIHLREPFIVKLLPFLKGILPTKLFDFVAGKLFRVYYSMDSFEHSSTENR